MTHPMTERESLRATAHQLLRDELGVGSVTRLCPRCGSSAHGRPLVVAGSGPAPFVSLSYATGLVAVAWSTAGPVGIDIEDAGPPVDGTDRQEFSGHEALLKAGEPAPVVALDLPAAYVGALAGTDVSWRLAGPAAPAAPVR
jgi:hypothetical protein